MPERTRRKPAEPAQAEQEPAAAQPRSRRKQGEAPPARRKSTQKAPAEPAAPPPLTPATMTPEQRAIARQQLIEDGERKKATSISISAHLLERAKAAVHLAGAKAILDGGGEDYDGPASFAQAVEYGLADIVLELEARYNDGKPFPTVYRLRPGPSAAGAKRGAELRKAKREQAAQDAQKD